jgi:hypothetical protein
LENEQSENSCRRPQKTKIRRESSCAGFDQNAGSDETGQASFDNKEAKFSRTKLAKPLSFRSEMAEFEEKNLVGRRLVGSERPKNAQLQ